MKIEIEIPDSAEWGISSVGFKPKTSEQYFKEMGGLAKQLFGQDTNLTKGNTLGHLLDISCVMGADLNNLILAVMTQAYLDWVSGNALDWLGDGRGIKRKQATKANYNTLEVTGEDGHIIYAGTIVVSNSGNRYEFTNNLILGVGAGIASISSVERGSTTGATANSITELEVPDEKVYSINNPTEVVAGNDVEIDDVYRERIRTQLNVTTGATVDAIKSALLGNDSVEFASVFENHEDETITVKGYEIDPGHILSIVFGSDMESAAKTQFGTRSAGIPTDGSSEHILRSLSGQNIKEKVQPGDKIATYIKVTKTGEQNYFGSNTEAYIKQDIVNYYALRIAPGTLLDYEKIRGKVEGNDDIESSNVKVEISKDGKEYVQEDIEFLASEMATITDTNIMFVGF